jgi:hypothetical protein
MSARCGAALPGLFGFLFVSHPAWVWFAEGYELLAIIAADLTAATRSDLARIVGCPPILVQSKKP